MEAQAVGKFRLFHLEPPLVWHKYGDPEEPREELHWVIVSDATVQNYRGPLGYVREPESKAFRSTERGEWVSGEELASFGGEFDHREALAKLGVVEIVDEIEEKE